MGTRTTPEGMNRIDRARGTWVCPVCLREFKLHEGEPVGVWHTNELGTYCVCQTCDLQWP